MFQLQLAHLNHAERERDLEADLRRRQLLKSTTDGGPLGAERSTSGASSQAVGRRVPAVQR